jgi:hypothetical protein
MTTIGRISYVLALIGLGLAGFLWKPDFWAGLVAATVVMCGVSLLDLAASRLKKRRGVAS